MATVVLSAASPSLPSLQTLSSLLTEQLHHNGETNLQTFHLATTKLAYCQGEFDCWVKTPGLCRAHDAEQSIVQAIHDADNLILLDAVTFGGHSYTIKRAQDRLICLLSPFFEKRAALTHHAARYGKAANFYALGWTPTNNESLSNTWAELADANAINMLAPHVGSTVVDDTDPSAWPSAIRDLLASQAIPGQRISNRAPLRDTLLHAAQGSHSSPQPPRNAAILIGSAKIKGTSVSENLARAIATRLANHSIPTEIHFATEFLNDEKAHTTAHQIASAGLFLLVSPLYVDALPALATRALEHIAQARAAAPSPALFATLLNCGFPEPEHNRTALQIARHFAATANYYWAGGLPLGAGGAINPTVPLDVQHGPSDHVRHSLDIAIPALAHGHIIPPAAIDLMATSPMPDSIYRLMGDIGWRYQAYKHGLSQSELKARPLDS
jgi:hypothetical protein